jgi:hypothetical protein
VLIFSVSLLLSTSVCAVDNVYIYIYIYIYIHVHTDMYAVVGVNLCSVGSLFTTQKILMHTHTHTHTCMHIDTDTETQTQTTQTYHV